MTMTRKEKKREWARQSYATAEGRKRHRERVLRHRYGIGLDHLQAMYELQEGACAICGTNGDLPYSQDQRGFGGKGALILDHDHSTGELRGLLCRKCNSGLGLFGDSAALLVKAAAYVMEGSDGN